MLFTYIFPCEMTVVWSSGRNDNRQRKMGEGRTRTQRTGHAQPQYSWVSTADIDKVQVMHTTAADISIPKQTTALTRPKYSSVYSPYKAAVQIYIISRRANHLAASWRHVSWVTIEWWRWRRTMGSQLSISNRKTQRTNSSSLHRAGSLAKLFILAIWKCLYVLCIFLTCHIFLVCSLLLLALPLA